MSRYQRVTPNQYLSERTSTGAFVNCSGLAKAGVPTNPPWVKPIASGFSTRAFCHAEIDHLYDYLPHAFLI